MSTGEVLDRTFNLYRNHFLLFSGIAMGHALCLLAGILVLIPMGAMLPLRGLYSLDPITILTTFGVYSLVIILFWVIGYALALGATVYAVSKVHLGQPATIRDSYRELRPLVLRTLRIVSSVFLRYVGAVVLTYLVVVVLGMVLVPIFIRVMGGHPPVLFRWLLAFFFLGLFILGIVWATRIYCRYSMAVPACLLEKLPARQALKRSKWLSKGSLGRIFLIFLLMGLLASGLSYAMQVPAVFLSEMNAATLAIAWQLGGAFMAMILASPIGTIAICLMYYDQRVRKEAFDLQLMMEALGQPLPVQASTGTPIG